MTGTAAWVARTECLSIDVGLDRKEALALARDLIARLREGPLNPAGSDLDDGVLDVLHAALETIAGDGIVDADRALEDASRLHRLILRAEGREAISGERAELLEAFSLWAWRLARKAGKPGLAYAWARGFAIDESALPRVIPGCTTDPKYTDPKDAKDAKNAKLDEPETLLALCGYLRRNWGTAPARIRDEAEFLYWHLESPRRSIGLFDEREYFLGEVALVAGTCCRFLSLRGEARRWFDRAEAAFRPTVNAVADWARVSYQRLALQAEERCFEEVLEMLPSLVESFEKLEMNEDALKCRFIEGLALMETDRPREALSVFHSVADAADRIGSPRLIASACVNLTQIYGLLGDATEAVSASRRAIPLLRGLDNKIDLAKIQCGIGMLLKTKGDLPQAIEAFREAQCEFRQLGMFADVAAIHLTVGEILLECGNEQQACAEVMVALPVIDRYGLVPEGMAALTLLREAVHQQRVNHQALRDLHAFFDDSVS